MDLFGFEQRHDPGGKRSFPLPAGMRGSAEFHGAADCYRTVLWREWDLRHDAPAYAMWIGMNPSTAVATKNDVTILREIDFTDRLTGLQRYLKVNVMDYRATHPGRLLTPGLAPRSHRNLPEIRDRAASADIIVLSFGAIDRRLRQYADETVKTLQADGRQLWCLGLTADGSPRHSSRLPKAIQLQRFAA